MKKPIFNWNEEDGTSLCVIYDRDKMYYGTATCHPEDRDMMSEKAGCELAYLRAAVMGLKSVRDELKTELQGLKKYYYSMNTSKHFNPESYEARRLMSHMDRLEKDIEIVKTLINQQNKQINDFIKNKDEYYKKIRKNRKLDKLLAEKK